MNTRDTLQNILGETRMHLNNIHTNAIYGSRALDVAEYRRAIILFINSLEKALSQSQDAGVYTSLSIQTEKFLEAVKGLSLHQDPDFIYFQPLAEKTLQFCENKKFKVAKRRQYDLPEKAKDLIILDYLFHDKKRSGFALKNKWSLTHKEGASVLLNESDIQAVMNGKKTILLNKEKTTKIYIVAHGLPGSNDIFYQSSDTPAKEIKLNFNTLATTLAKIIGDHKVVVNLAVCYGARGTDENPYTSIEKSFAAKLHKCLMQKLGRNVPVIARVQKVGVVVRKNDFVKGSKLTYDLNYTVQQTENNTKNLVKRLHKQPGSKVIFTTDQKGHRIVLDFYSIKWKQEFMTVLTTLRNNAPVITQRNFIDNWLSQFNDKNPKEILNYLQVQLGQPHSAFIQFGKQHRLFSSPSPFIDAINDSVKYGEKIINQAVPARMFKKVSSK